MKNEKILSLIIQPVISRIKSGVILAEELVRFVIFWLCVPLP